MAHAPTQRTGREAPILLRTGLDMGTFDATRAGAHERRGAVRTMNNRNSAQQIAALGLELRGPEKRAPGDGRAELVGEL
jgi:hypothetical protein